MLLSEKIQQYIKKLPIDYQSEVLDFVQYLLEKEEREKGREEEVDWSSSSLVSAMRGMEKEDTPVYTTSDLKVKFS